MITTSNELLDALRERGQTAMGAVASHGSKAESNGLVGSITAQDRPWYVTAILGVSGWLAGLFMLGFVAVLFHPEHAAAAATCGVVLVAAAWGLFMADRDGAFVGQLGLALSIAGQCLLIFAMTDNTRGIAPIASAALVLQIALALLMPNHIHRTVSTLFATIAWALTVRFALFGEPDFWRHDIEAETSVMRAAGAWLFAWAPVGLLLWALIRNEARWMSRGWQSTLRPVFTGLIVGLSFATLASQPFESFRWFGSSGSGANWLALWPLLSALGALGGLAAAFALRSRGLIGACAVAVLLHVSNFYFEMGVSLLFKSLLMLAMGAAMLVASRAFNASASTEESTS